MMKKAAEHFGFAQYRHFGTVYPERSRRNQWNRVDGILKSV